MRKPLVVFMLIAGLGCAGCKTSRPTIKPPAGFAVYTKDTGWLKAISALGVRIRVRATKNEPYGDHLMWSAASTAYLKSQGYHLITQTEITSGKGLKGLYGEYIYRFNGENYLYALTVYADKNKIYYIETGGPEVNYTDKREQILTALATLEPEDGKP